MILIRIIILIGFCGVSYAGELYQTAVMAQSFAPNAGGQVVYALRRGTDSHEWSVFSNQYLKAGSYPLTGALYSKRYTLCGISCPVQFFGQLGVGASTAGPMLEFLWSINFLWVGRLDFVSHLYFTKQRIVVWNYPIWLGVSLPL